MMIPARTRVYIAPYHATQGTSPGSPCGSAVAAFKKIVALGDWPFDYGDDPSFYAMKKFKSPLTWGVCRPDVRNGLSEGDIVVFFSYLKFKETGDSQYRLSAVATVERTVRRTDIWQDPGLRRFKNYFNLLIRPAKSKRDGWVHEEPTLRGDTLRIHKDWLWRICEHRGLRKDHFRAVEATNHFDSRTAVRGSRLTVARNYIIFSAALSDTLVLSNPPVVAWHSKGKPAEQWNADKFSQRVKELTLFRANEANGKKRWLRIQNSQRAHRHIVFELPPAEAEHWRKGFLALIGRR